MWDPARGLENLNEAIRQAGLADRPCPPCLCPCQALPTTPATTTWPSQPLTTHSVAKSMMPGNPMAIGTDLVAHLVAMGAFRDAREKDRADASLRQAGRDAQELERFPALPMSYMWRCVLPQLDKAGAGSSRSWPARATKRPRAP